MATTQRLRATRISPVPVPLFCARKNGTAFVQLDYENSNSIQRLYSLFAWTVRLLFAFDYLLCLSTDGKSCCSTSRWGLSRLHHGRRAKGTF
jgi:hypothetical protein